MYSNLLHIRLADLSLIQFAAKYRSEKLMNASWIKLRSKWKCSGIKTSAPLWLFHNECSDLHVYNNRNSESSYLFPLSKVMQSYCPYQFRYTYHGPWDSWSTHVYYWELMMKHYICSAIVFVEHRCSGAILFDPERLWWSSFIGARINL